MKKIELTEEELEVLNSYLFHKLINLENSNLTDSKCYRVLYSIYRKLNKEEK